MSSETHSKHAKALASRAGSEWHSSRLILVAGADVRTQAGLSCKVALDIPPPLRSATCKCYPVACLQSPEPAACAPAALDRSGYVAVGLCTLESPEQEHPTRYSSCPGKLATAANSQSKSSPSGYPDPELPPCFTTFEPTYLTVGAFASILNWVACER